MKTMIRMSAALIALRRARNGIRGPREPAARRAAAGSCDAARRQAARRAASGRRRRGAAGDGRRARRRVHPDGGAAGRRGSDVPRRHLIARRGPAATERSHGCVRSRSKSTMPAIAVADATGVLALEPGYARRRARPHRHGDEARWPSARLQPRQTSNRFWNALSMEPGSAGSEIAQERRGARVRAARLAVEAFGEGATDAVLVVPGRLPHRAARAGARSRAGMRHASSRARRHGRGRERAAVPESPAAVRRRGALSARGHAARAETATDASVRAEESLDHHRAREPRGGVRAPHRRPVRARDAVRSVAPRRDGAGALRPAAGVARAAAARGTRRAHARAPRRGVRSGGRARGRARRRGRFLSRGRAAHRAAPRARPEHGRSRWPIASRRCRDSSAELARLDDAHIEPLAPGHAARSVLLRPELIEAQQRPGEVASSVSAWRAAAAPCFRPRQRPRHRRRGRALRGAPTHLVYGGVVYRVGVRGLVVGREPVDGRRTIVIADQLSGVSRAHCEVVLRDGELKLRDLEPLRHVRQREEDRRAKRRCSAPT